MTNSLLRLAVAAALGSSTPGFAQNVWVVDDDGGADFTEVRSAVFVAGEGDVILVRDGLYKPFSIIGKSLTIQAEAGHRPVIAEPDPNAEIMNVSVSSLAAGQEVYLRGLHIAGTYFGIMFAIPYVQVWQNDGEVWIEDCKLARKAGISASGQIGVLAWDCAGVHLVRCEIRAARTKVDASQGTNLTMWDCTTTAANGVTGIGYPGVSMRGGSLFVSGGRIEATSVTIAPGGDAVLLDEGAQAWLRDVQLQPGAGSPPGTALNVLDGTHTPVPGSSRSFFVSSPVRAGVDPVTLTYAGEPGDLVVLLWSTTGQMAPFYLALEHGPFVIDLSGLGGAVVGTLDETGVLVDVVPPLPMPVGNAVTLPCQATFLEPGQGWFLSGPSQLLLLSSAS